MTLWPFSRLALSAPWILCPLLLWVMSGCSAAARLQAEPAPVEARLRIGWSQADLTPTETVLLGGQLYARLSEGVADPLTATALALESDRQQVIFVSCDMISIAEDFRAEVRAALAGRAAGLDANNVILNATHTHTAPYQGAEGFYGLDVKAMKPQDYRQFLVGRIADAVVRAWESRAPGGIAYGTGWAVVGRNRHAVYTSGKAAMYGKTDQADFSHILGYEDHSVGFLATYDRQGHLTGLAANVACPAQVSASTYQVSADFWHETRLELRRRFGAGLFILPQCSSAGDQAPHPLYDKKALARMLTLRGRTERQDIACRIADAAQETLPYLTKAVDWSPRLVHRTEVVDLPQLPLTEADVQSAREGMEKARQGYEKELAKLAADPSLREKPRWYKDVTWAYRNMEWQRGVLTRYAQQETEKTRPSEIHVIRLGDVAVVTMPFEYYLDYGVAIKARSPATQTFLVQLAGSSTYLPTERALAGGGYGAVAASYRCGPEAGRQLAARVVELLQQLWMGDHAAK